MAVPIEYLRERSKRGRDRSGSPEHCWMEAGESHSVQPGEQSNFLGDQEARGHRSEYTRLARTNTDTSWNDKHGGQASTGPAAGCGGYLYKEEAPFKATAFTNFEIE